jgi:HlyD family secretion protein
MNQTSYRAEAVIRHSFNVAFSRNRRRSAARRNGVVIPLIVAALLAVGGLASLIYFTYFSGSNDKTVDLILKPVVRGEFVAKVIDQGEIQSAENIEIKCQVGSRNGTVQVIDVIAEGTKVKEGDWLITLDSTPFRKELEQQLLALSRAETDVIKAQATLDTAKAAKQEYIEGRFKEQQRTILNDQFNAEQELQQAENYLEYSVNLQKKGYITKMQLRADEIAVEKARNKVALEEQKLKVLEEITLKKELVTLESDIAAAEVGYKNSIEARGIEQGKYDEINKQIEFCTINVPPGVKGEVVFHKEVDRRGGSEWILERGANVREQQVLIKIPNASKMEVKCLINEQAIALVRQNMPASISVDAIPGKTLKGYVTKVNNYAEPSGFMSGSNVREYAIFIRILEPPKELISGMKTSVNIQTEYQPSVLQAPLQCIYSVNDEAYVLRRKAAGAFETLKVGIRGENSTNVWIESGVDEGDQLVMAPGEYKDLMDLPEIVSESRIELPDGTVVEPADATETTSAPGPGSEEVKVAQADRGGEKRGKGEGRPEGAGGGAPGGGGQGGGGQGGGGQGGGGQGGFSVDMIVDRTMSRYDTNSDGQIDAEEQKGFDERARRIADSDQNGDGNISRDEIKTAMEAMMRQFQQNGGGGGGGGGPN